MDISDIHAAWRVWMYMMNLAVLGNHGFSRHMWWYSAQTHSIECSGWTFSSSPLSFWSLVAPSPKRLFQVVPPKFCSQWASLFGIGTCMYIYISVHVYINVNVYSMYTYVHINILYETLHLSLKHCACSSQRFAGLSLSWTNCGMQSAVCTPNIQDGTPNWLIDPSSSKIKKKVFGHPEDLLRGVLGGLKPQLTMYLEHLGDMIFTFHVSWHPGGLNLHIGSPIRPG